MGAGRTFLGGWAAARGARPRDGGALRRPNSSPKLGGQALTAAEPREAEHERHHGLQAANPGPSRRRAVVQQAYGLWPPVRVLTVTEQPELLSSHAGAQHAGRRLLINFRIYAVRTKDMGKTF
eukprot:SAG31_NODE_25120_length_467_cov_1.543478_1_plen_123_part_00